jgi:hypothetical protein
VTRQEFALAVLVVVSLNLPLAFAGCSNVTASDRERATRYAIDVLREGCPYYEASPSEWRRSPELEQICPILTREPVDAGAEGG